jgi:hypothetical protein
MSNANRTKGVSLAKGPIALVGLVLLAYGVTGFIFGGHSFAMHPVAGTVNGKNWLGIEVNAWSSLLFIAAGLLLVVGAPGHWTAKGMALIVGLVLFAAAVIAAYDGTDVFGIFAANRGTKIFWAIAGVALIVLSLLPRVGGRKREPQPREEREQRFTRERPADEEPVARREGATTGGRGADGSR